MYALLPSLRVVEASSFVASPTAGLYLAQLGAEVIRFDQIGGGPDFKRWPLSPSGSSLYWEGLNKGKKSIAIDLGRPEGRELAQRLATAPGANAGLLLTNYPVNSFLAHDRLVALRPDLVTVRVMGLADGGNALDYTVNCAVGFPQITGPASLGNEPVNHVLPAWDLLTGAYAAFALLAAERSRRESGKGREVRVPLMDMATATISNLGMIGEVLSTGADRTRYGNQLYGAFGRDFVTADGKRLVIMAITQRQWAGLIESLGLREAVAHVEADRGVNFSKDEGLRFEHRDTLVPLVAQAVAQRNSDELFPDFDARGVCWGPYKGMYEAATDPALVARNPIFSSIEHVSGLTYPTAGAPVTIPEESRGSPIRAPRLGEHTDEVLLELLGLASGEVGSLHDAGVVAGPE
ncbi:CAIB/BAIF family protein [Sphingobium indicum BiD32]|uniref:CAIB/BAIF family protein n=1 Tax=Sphingobium indicum BiD32 TaxID=1301087 RepID=N1MSS0_9SPHN|nr:CoA transferase [Sphingobium indicum]CCW18697.1 CAIB/BAIF family protein [Sphingobium indicum BiD32]